MKRTFFALVLSSLAFVSCGEKEEAPAETESQAILRDVSVDEAAGLISSREDIVVLDVRTPEEFAEGHIAGAVNIDFKGADFAEKIGDLDPGKAYVFHCRSGNRSGQSIPVLKKAGLSELYHLNSGIIGWTEAGQPLEK